MIRWYVNLLCELMIYDLESEGLVEFTQDGEKVGIFYNY